MPMIPAPHYSVWIRVDGTQTRIDTNPDAMTRAEVVALLQAVERELLAQEDAERHDSPPESGTDG